MTLYNKRREAMEVTIRLARQEDVPDIITLLIKQHGNYYPNADFYNTDFLRGAIKKEELYVAVAELENGLVAGITGANKKNQFAGALELNMLTIRPSHRGFALGKRLLSFLLETLHPETYTCTYTHCMSLDVISQKICADLGCNITGALLNCYRVDAHAENFSGLDLPVKHNLVVTCLAEGKKDAGPLYAPPAHAAYITGVYDALGAAYTLMDREGTPGSSPSVCTVIQIEEHRYCEIFAEKIGPDFEGILEDALKQYAPLEKQSFNVFINLNDPAAPRACVFLGERGFSFAGIHPLSGLYEYIIFHYSPALAISFDRIAVLPGFAKNFAYIRDRYERKG
jgi:GNAT superfamily N-acetyltransferase